MVIKQLTKKVLITTAMASSLFILPQFATHHASAATVTINTTHQTLSVGKRGSAVTSLQTRLKELGYFNHTIDGDYGTLTKNAVMSYQRANHLTADGVAGPATLAKLFSANSTASSSTSSVSTISSAVTSSIRSVQTRLKSLGYYTGAVDGIKGSGTTAAIKNFQAANGLTADGVVGPMTLAKLNSANSTTSIQSVSTTTSSSALANKIISDAEALQGIRYLYGGTTTSGFDCSGFTQYVFGKNGISLPRTAAEQMAAGAPTSLVPGALVFFSTVSAGPSHVGIYIGNNEFISATSSDGIAIASLSNSYWGPRYLGARTFLK